MFIRLFNGANKRVRIIYCRMRSDNVIMIGELVKDVGESIVANTNYGISMQVQRKTTGNLIQSRWLQNEILTRIRNAFYNATFSVVEHGYVR
jgi:hypothetical protein